MKTIKSIICIFVGLALFPFLLLVLGVLALSGQDRAAKNLLDKYFELWN